MTNEMSNTTNNEMNEELEVVNLTPHAIVYQRDDGSRVTYAPSGQVARVSTVQGAPVKTALPFKVLNAPVRGPIEGLPIMNYKCDKVYIVSGMVADALRTSGNLRPDVFSPGTGPQDGAIRENGQVVAVTCFIASCIL